MDFHVKEIIEEIFKDDNLSSITLGFKGLGGLALVIYFTILINDMLLTGASIDFKRVGKGVFYAIMLSSWTYVSDIITTGMTEIQTAFTEGIPNNTSMDAKYQEVVKKLQVIPNIDTETDVDKAKEDKSFFAMIPDYVKQKTIETANTLTDVFNIIARPELLILKILIFISYLINTIILFLFNCFTYIWMNILQIGGILALAMYLFPRFENSFSNWLQTYIAVFFWIPVGSLMIYICDQLFIKVIDKTLFNDNSGITSGVTIFSQVGSGAQIILFCVICIACVYLKALLLSKVPSIVSYWIGGGNTGDMFSGMAKTAQIGLEGGKAVGSSGGSMAMKGGKKIVSSMKGK